LPRLPQAPTIRVCPTPAGPPARRRYHLPAAPRLLLPARGRRTRRTLRSQHGISARQKILITGLLSNRSIAYGIAQACKREGAELAFTYVGERFKDRITKFAEEFDSKLVRLRRRQR
jgi:hypothetical protein